MILITLLAILIALSFALSPMPLVERVQIAALLAALAAQPLGISSDELGRLLGEFVASMSEGNRTVLLIGVIASVWAIALRFVWRRRVSSDGC